MSDTPILERWKLTPADRRTILFPFVGDRVGGSHRSAISLIEALTRRGFNTVVVLEVDGRLSEVLRRENIPYVVVSSPMRRNVSSNSRLAVMQRFAKGYRRARSILKQINPAIVHINDSPTLIAWGMPCKSLQIPYVWHQRTIAVPSRIISRFLSWAAKVICISKIVAESISTELEDRKVVVANPISLPAPCSDNVRQIRKEINAQLQIPLEEVAVLLFIGNLREIKRPLVFADTVLALNVKLGVPSVGIVVGDNHGQYAGKMNDRFRGRGLAKRLFFADFQLNVQDWIVLADVLVAPGIFEGFGRTLVEAMSLGVPVVAADVNGHREIINNRINGLAVEPDEPLEFAEAVREVLQDLELRKFVIEKGHLTVQEYSPSQHTRQVEKVYESIWSDEGT